MERSFHSTRHFFASQAFANGWDPQAVASQLAHHSPSFTAKQYVHPTERERSMEWAVVEPVTVVTEWSQGSQDGDDDTANHLILERETGIEPATLSLGS